MSYCEIDALNLGSLTDEDAQKAKDLSEWWQKTRDLLDPVPKGETVPGFTWPAAVTIRPSHWDLDRQTYKLAWGDTLSGLASTYLGSPTRWREIWDIQPDQFRYTRNPDKLNVGEVLLMPDDAVATLLVALGYKPKKGTPHIPTTPPTIQPGKPKGAAPASKSALRTDDTIAWIVGGGLAVAALLYMSKKK